MNSSAPEPIVVRQGLDAVRHLQRLFFHEGEPTAYELINFVMHDIYRARIGNALFQRSGSIYAVSSSVDWLRVADRTVEQLFQGLIVPPPPPNNSWRSEAMLAAFGSGVFTSGQYGSFSKDLSLSDLPDDIVKSLSGSARVLAWRFE